MYIQMGPMVVRGKTQLLGLDVFQCTSGLLFIVAPIHKLTKCDCRACAFICMFSLDILSVSTLCLHIALGSCIELCLHIALGFGSDESFMHHCPTRLYSLFVGLLGAFCVTLSFVLVDT